MKQFQTINKQEIYKIDDENIIQTNLEVISKSKQCLPKDLLVTLQNERNISDSTINTYRSAILSYEKFHNLSMHDLLSEALYEQKNTIT